MIRRHALHAMGLVFGAGMALATIMPMQSHAQQAGNMIGGAVVGAGVGYLVGGNKGARGGAVVGAIAGARK